MDKSKKRKIDTKSPTRKCSCIREGGAGKIVSRSEDCEIHGDKPTKGKKPDIRFQIINDKREDKKLVKRFAKLIKHAGKALRRIEELQLTRVEVEAAIVTGVIEGDIDEKFVRRIFTFVTQLEK